MRMPTEGKGLIFLGFSLIVLLSLLSFHVEDHSKNWLGLVGWGIGLGFNFLFGLTSYLVLAFLGWLGWQFLLNREVPSLPSKIVYFGILPDLRAACCLISSLNRACRLAASLKIRVYSETHYSISPILIAPRVII